MKKSCFSILLAFLFIVSCENTLNDTQEIDEDKCSQENINREAYKYLKDWYLWYEHLPEINPADYETMSAMINAVKYREGDKLIDRFSYSVQSPSMMIIMPENVTEWDFHGCVTKKIYFIFQWFIREVRLIRQGSGAVREYLQ